MTHAAVAWMFQQILKLVLKTPIVRMPSGELQIATTPLFGLTMLGLYLAVVLSLSTLTFRYVEEPLRLKSRQVAASWKARVPARSALQQSEGVISN